MTRVLGLLFLALSLGAAAQDYGPAINWLEKNVH